LSDSESKIELAVKNYLKDEDIIVDNIQFEFDGGLEEMCQACNCTTGTKIVVTVQKGNSIKVEELGFEKI